MIHTWSGTPPDVRKKCTDLYLHYYPMESDAKLPHETKLLMIDEWFQQDFAAMASVGYTKQCFETAVAESRILFRKGVLDLMTRTNEHKIPLFVLSAGIKEVIEASFRQLDPAFEGQEHLRLISNTFVYQDSRTSRPPDVLINPNTKQTQLYRFA